MEVPGSLFSGREPEAEGGALGGRFEELDIAAVGAENALGDGESEAGAFGSVGEKGVKDLGLLLAWDAFTGITDNESCIALLSLCFDVNGSASVHGLGSVEDEIEDDLLDLSFVDFNGEALTRGVELYLYLLLLEF